MGGGLFDLEFGQGSDFFAPAGRVLELRQLDIEVAADNADKIVAAALEDIGQQHEIVGDGVEVCAGFSQQRPLLLEIVADDETGARFEQRLEVGENSGGVQLIFHSRGAMPERQVSALAGDGPGDADELCFARIDAVCQNPHGKEFGRPEIGVPILPVALGEKDADRPGSF